MSIIISDVMWLAFPLWILLFILGCKFQNFIISTASGIIGCSFAFMFISASSGFTSIIIGFVVLLLNLYIIFKATMQDVE